MFPIEAGIDSVYFIDFKTMSKYQILRESLKMRREKFDYLLLSPISNTRASQILALIVNSKMSVGVQLKNTRKQKCISNELKHIVSKNLDLVKALGYSNNLEVPKLYISKIGLSVEIKDNTIALCIGTSIPQKTWAIENYLKVARFFLEKGYYVVILGGKKERAELEKISLPKGIIDLTGKLSLIESAGVAGKSKLVIGGDTGVMHMAAAVGAATLTLFSCTNPYLHCPYSEHSYFYKKDLDCQFCAETIAIAEVGLHCSDCKCIKEILPKDICSLAKDIIDGSADDMYKYKLEVNE